MASANVCSAAAVLLLAVVAAQVAATGPPGPGPPGSGPTPDVCEDDDEVFVFNASLHNFTVTSCAEDAPGMCGIPEPATICCATCAEAVTMCVDYDDTLSMFAPDIPSCSLAPFFGFCEDDMGRHMCCESCSANLTCQDNDELLAAWGVDLATCTDAPIMGWCADDNIRAACCASCSDPTCEDHDDIFAMWEVDGADDCGTYVEMYSDYGVCDNENTASVCCESCSHREDDEHTDGEEYCERPSISAEECERSECCHWNTDGSGMESNFGEGRCWSSIGDSECTDMYGDYYDDDDSCEGDDDMTFVWFASMQNITATSCAEDAPGFCFVSEVAYYCCETCSEALMECNDYDDTVAFFGFGPTTCSDAVPYGFCESTEGSYTCCESCSDPNPTCADYDDVVASFGAEGLETCNDAYLYGLCDDENMYRYCCETCSNPTCMDNDDRVPLMGIPGVETCSTIVMYDYMFGFCSDQTIGRVCCESCSEPEATTAPTPAPCADSDARIVQLASNAGVMISGCGDVESFCEHRQYGSTVQATCPETCGMCCEDDDDTIVMLANNAGVMISGCGDVEAFCEHATYGSLVSATCPVTCDSCTRRLADGKRIDEFTVVASPVSAPAPGIMQKTEEFGSPNARLFYP